MKLGSLFSTLANGKNASSHSTASNETSEQRARLSDYQRALRGEATWKGVSKLVGAVTLALVGTIVVLATQFSPRVVVWEREPDGMQHIVGDAQRAVTPSDVTIDASLVTFVRYMREIPNGDYRFIDRNLEIAHRRMTVPSSPAERAELTYWSAHNPKLSAAQVTRIVLDRNPAPIVTRQGDSLTWQITWAEQVKDAHGVLRAPVLFSGSVTMAHEPTLTTDRATGMDNAGGINVWSYVLPESD